MLVACDSDIEPDDLVSKYLESKAKLLEYERGQPRDLLISENDEQLAVAKLEAKIRKIESDVLFDKYEADQQWRVQRVDLERQLAAAKHNRQDQAGENLTVEGEPELEMTDVGDISNEAERIAAEILAEASDEDNDIGGLFASLPQNEVDARTGESRTVVNSADGNQIVIRDFGKSTGISPRRALEEACRSR
jgi:ATP-dependent RNA helicase DHX29